MSGVRRVDWSYPTGFAGTEYTAEHDCGKSMTIATEEIAQRWLDTHEQAGCTALLWLDRSPACGWYWVAACFLGEAGRGGERE